MIVIDELIWVAFSLFGRLATIPVQVQRRKRC